MNRRGFIAAIVAAVTGRKIGVSAPAPLPTTVSNTLWAQSEFVREKMVESFFSARLNFTLVGIGMAPIASHNYRLPFHVTPPEELDEAPPALFESKSLPT